VIARASLLARKLPEGDKMRDELITITEAGERASALTKQLLAFSSAQVLKRDRIRFDEAVSELANLLAPILGEDVELDFTFEASDAVVLGDRSQLEQVITNLLVNARDAMPEGGTLGVHTRMLAAEAAPQDVDAAAGYVQLAVEDTGIGMDEATAAKIFDPYFTTKRGQGTGLGLATVYGIVRQSGGHIGVRSTLGVGTTFTVTLPLCEGEADERVKPMKTERPMKPRRDRLLLVEDHPDVRAALELALADCDYDVVVATSPDEALALSDEALADIDVLVTDIVMPRINGQTLARSLRERSPALHVLFVSGYSPDLTLLESLPQARFLAKPFRPSELVRALNALRADEDAE
jgi:two-component system cell cycle sensor histidine kinase/response regulator CckA